METDIEKLYQSRWGQEFNMAFERDTAKAAHPHYVCAGHGT